MKKDECCAVRRVIGADAVSLNPWDGRKARLHDLVEDDQGDTVHVVHSILVSNAVCAAYFPDKVQIQHCQTKPESGFGQEAIECIACPLRDQRERTMQSKGSRNSAGKVVADIEFDNAGDLSAKAILAVKFNELIEKRGLIQTKAASLTGMTQPKVSQMCRYKLQNISLERLMRALVSLDQQVQIVVRSACCTHGACIQVAVRKRVVHIETAGEFQLQYHGDKSNNRSDEAAI